MIKVCFSKKIKLFEVFGTHIKYFKIIKYILVDYYHNVLFKVLFPALLLDKSLNHILYKEILSGTKY